MLFLSVWGLAETNCQNDDGEDGGGDDEEDVKRNPNACVCVEKWLFIVTNYDCSRTMDFILFQFDSLRRKMANMCNAWHWMNATPSNKIHEEIRIQVRSQSDV